MRLEKEAASALTRFTFSSSGRLVERERRKTVYPVAPILLARLVPTVPLPTTIWIPDI